EGEEHTGEEGDLDVGEKGLRKAGIDQSAPSLTFECLGKRPDEEAEYLFGEEVADAEGRHDGDGGVEEAAAQFEQMVEQGHLTLLFLLVFIHVARAHLRSAEVSSPACDAVAGRVGAGSGGGTAGAAAVGAGKGGGRSSGAGGSSLVADTSSGARRGRSCSMPMAAAISRSGSTAERTFLPTCLFTSKSRVASIVLRSSSSSASRPISSIPCCNSRKVARA